MCYFTSAAAKILISSLWIFLDYLDNYLAWVSIFSFCAKFCRFFYRCSPVSICTLNRYIRFKTHSTHFKPYNRRPFVLPRKLNQFMSPFKPAPTPACFPIKRRLERNVISNLISSIVPGSVSREWRARLASLLTHTLPGRTQLPKPPTILAPSRRVSIPAVTWSAKSGNCWTSMHGGKFCRLFLS